MPIFRAVVDQQQDVSTSHALTQYIQKPLRLTVDPVQVFKDQDQGLVETLTQEEFLDAPQTSVAAGSVGPSAATVRAVLPSQAAQTDRAACLQDCGPESRPCL